MSVIYKTLKKMRTQAIAVEGRTMGPRLERQAEPGRKKRFYLVFAVLFVSINIVLIIGFYFGLGRFNPTGSKPSQAVKSEVGNSGSEMSGGDSDQRIVVRKSIATDGKPNSTGASFLPAAPEADHPKKTKPEVVATAATPQKTAPAAVVTYKLEPEKKIISEIEVLPDPPQDPKRVIKPRRSRSAPEASAAAGIRPHAKIQRIRAAKIHRENVEKSLKLSQLIRQIQRSMVAGSVEQTQQLMDRLEVIQGKDHYYVLKLRAFWCIQKQDYATAYPLLERVIEENAKDLEAGINLAVCEIKTNRFNDAHQRLTRLSEFYPENYQVTDMLHQVKKYIGEP